MTVLNDPSYIHKVTKLSEELERMEKEVGLCFDVIDDEEEIEAVLGRMKEERKEEGEKEQVKEEVKEVKEVKTEEKKEETPPPK